MMRKIVFILFFCPIVLIAQKPFINSISPTHIEVGETVTISGSNLSGTTHVYFGGVSATFTEISGSIIEATVPAGATNDNIYVINNNLIAQSSQRFFISFVGTDISNYDGEWVQNTGEKAASDLCLCDLNGDSKNDIVVVHNFQSGDGTNEATIYLNNTAGTGSFSGTDFQLTQSLNVSSNESGFFSIVCADLNNDGDNDLAFSSNSGGNVGDIFILAGDGSGTFSNTPTTIKNLLNTPSNNERQPGSIEAADLNGDGLLDLIVGNRTDGTFHIFENSGGLTFGNAVEIVANNEPTGLIKVSDFNNDGYPDLATLDFRQSNTGIHIFKNTSTSSTFNFEFQQTITNGGQTSDVVTGDLDNDGLLDIVVASRNSGRITTFENQSSSSSISFGGANNLTTTGNSPFGVDLGDLNGDGLIDIVSSYATQDIYIFPNTSSGSISFGSEVIQSSSSSTTQSVVVGDLNGDAKPDIVYSRDVQITEVGSLGIILNRNCVTPVLSPAPGGGGVFCSNPETFTLKATASPGATYDWTVTGNTNAGGNNFNTGTTNSATFDLASNATTTIQVTITQDATCSAQSDTQVYTIAASVTGSPTINTSEPGVLCFGDNVTLSTASSYDNYFWTLPDGSTATTATISLNPVSTTDAGVYSLRVQNSGSCSSAEVSQLIEVSRPPQLEIANNNLDDFCAGTNVSLEVVDFRSDGYTYEWQLDNVDFGAGSVPSISTNQAGNYTVEVTDINTCITETASYTINSVALPNSVANGPTETCVDFLTSFTSSSTGDGSFTLQYEWIVENAADVVIHTATTQNLDFTFPSVGNYEVILNTSYDPLEVYAGGGGSFCRDSDPIAVNVSDPPAITFNVTDGVQKCQAETINVAIQSPASATISSYNWSLRNAAATPNDTIISANFSTGNSVDASIPLGIDSVYVIAAITTSIGCDVIDSVKVVNFPSAADITSPDADVVTTDMITLEESNFIRLSAQGITNVTWEPSDIFDNANAIDVTAFPDQPSTVITVTGTDVNNCTVSSQITLSLDNLRPKRTFSPNGDGMNDCWEILNSSQPNTQGCKIYIFDSRGKEIKVADAPFASNCVWDGNANGTPVPEGVYYFVFKCNDSQMSKSGSILLAR